MYKSFNNLFSEYCILHNNSFEIVQKQLEYPDIEKMEGYFYLMNQSIYAFKEREIKQRFFFKNQWIELPKNAILYYERVNIYECKIEWKTNDEIIFCILYYQPSWGKMDRMGYTEDEEDYNFGLWLYKKWKSH